MCPCLSLPSLAVLSPSLPPLLGQVADVDETLGEQFLSDIDPTKEELMVRFLVVVVIVVVDFGCCCLFVLVGDPLPNVMRTLTTSTCRQLFEEQS